MFEVIAYFFILVFMVLVVAYFMVEAQRKKDRELKKQQIITRVTVMKDNYKQAVLSLVQQRLLNKRGQESVYRIANNFFVFQAVTIENIERCETLLESVIAAMPEVYEQGDNVDYAQGIISLFVRGLPTTSAGHSINFYQQQLPSLITQLKGHLDLNDASLIHQISETAA